MKILLDKVPSLPGEEARAIVEHALGRPIHEVFSEFNDEAIGAASIGQVHFARLLDGRPVAVKIKYPNSYELYKQDLYTMRLFCNIAQPEVRLCLCARAC